ncbi:MAG: sugar phosphate nucleotidyltransferase [Pseudomonadota bacterium]|nr:sugar phosphate nucleotidyltransferase [Pseudomonadota bacterium]|tara:strand:+ start:11370 stop:12071 length:702 start_codon:yes stop_codon:yes gene_type:complete
MSIEDIKIFILVGGFGTRLRSVVDDVPKPMAPINNKPFLAYKIETIREYLPKNQIYLLTHYMSDIIEKFFENDKTVKIIKEDMPMGTGGSFKNAVKLLNLKDNERIMLMNGDTYIKPNYFDFIENSSKEINMMTSMTNDCSRFNTLVIKNNKIVDFKEKTPNAVNKYINIGCYVFNNLNFIKNIPDKCFSLEEKFKDFINLIDIKPYEYKGVFIDIGIPDDYKRLINEKINEK